MSTVLVDTDGGSVFNATDSFGGPIGDKLIKKIPGLSNVNLSITDDIDAKPVLKPRRTVIDVVNDFSWYAGPKSTPAALNKVPCIFIQEREQQLSSLVAGAAYYLNAASRVVNGAVGELEELISRFGDIKLKGERIALANAEDQSILKAHNLKSLEGIYFTKETGFNYRLPLYDQPGGVANAFGFEGGGIARSFVDKLQTAGDSIAEIANIGQPGVFIEKPKYFTNATEGRSETVTFPLANTIRRHNHSPIQQNAELLWLLSFQNKPYKTTFGRTLPPKIYQVSVPGRFSMPYAYISNMSVQFEGTVRNTNVYFPSGNGEGVIGSRMVNTPVPEAYTVSLQFTELIGSYGNTMLSPAFTTSVNNNIITIGKTPQ